MMNKLTCKSSINSIFVLFIFSLLFFSLSNSAFARLDVGFDTGNSCPSGQILKDPLGCRTFEQILDSIANFLIIISAPIVAIMVLYGGYQILFAGGNPEKFKEGKQTILYAVIGFIIILIAKGITALIKNILGAS